MSFAALKERRAARDARWRTRGPLSPEERGSCGRDDEALAEDRASAAGLAAEQNGAAHNDQPAPYIPTQLADAPLSVAATRDEGRGLRRAADAPAAKQGNELLAVEPQVSVLSASQVAVRCHYCFRQQTPLQRCSRCKYARYCSEACQRHAWTGTRHRDECAALQRWYAAAQSAGHAGADPGAPVRALAQLVWQRHKHGTDSAWWRDVASMQTHRADLSDAQLAECAELAFHVAQFVSPDALPKYGFANARALLDLVCAYRINAFTLADAQLDPIGVSISVPVALCNHACEPNAVVVFPVAGQRTMRVVAIRPIEPGEEIRTSYVDLAETHAQRQATLQERYLFRCTCALCRRGERPPRSWTDPRTAFWCRTPSCTGWAAMPDWRRLPLDEESVATGPCNRCGQTSTVHGAHAIHERWSAAEALAAKTQTAMRGDAKGLPIADVLPTVYWLSTLVPPSNALLWTLLHAAHVLAIEQQRFPEATQLALVLCAGMQAPGARSEQSTLYPLGHPLRAVLLATLGKLLLHESPPCAPLLARIAPLPSDRGVQLALAKQALIQALDEAKIGFGTAVDGGEVAADIRDALQTLEQEQAALARSL
ncbi:hypothetical protein MOBT1_002271 [Malassezia obtusa]|uniref:Uncharacterized protein n=1 Tax=Malassezia obtusa TaxID=76774 RepID=A0AAF0DZN0_9BASI|nr:hypothetical protein MOBT1_002271 [Malassezia obtusa]